MKERFEKYIEKKFKSVRNTQEVKEIKEEGAVKSDEISEAEMNALYTKLLEKVGTIMNDIAPNYASSDSSLMNSLV